MAILRNVFALHFSAHFDIIYDFQCENEPRVPDYMKLMIISANTRNCKQNSMQFVLRYPEAN